MPGNDSPSHVSAVRRKIYLFILYFKSLFQDLIKIQKAITPKYIH